MTQCLHLIAADGKYGNHRYLGSLKDKPCGAVARLRRDRVRLRRWDRLHARNDGFTGWELFEFGRG